MGVVGDYNLADETHLASDAAFADGAFADAAFAHAATALGTPVTVTWVGTRPPRRRFSVPGLRQTRLRPAAARQPIHYEVDHLAGKAVGKGQMALEEPVVSGPEDQVQDYVGVGAGRDLAP